MSIPFISKTTESNSFAQDIPIPATSSSTDKKTADQAALIGATVTSSGAVKTREEAQTKTVGGESTDTSADAAYLARLDKLGYVRTAPGVLALKQQLSPETLESVLKAYEEAKASRRVANQAPRNALLTLDSDICTAIRICKQAEPEAKAAARSLLSSLMKRMEQLSKILEASGT